MVKRPARRPLPRSRISFRVRLQRARASVSKPGGHGELAECAALAPLAAPPLVTPVVPEAHVCGAGADTENISPGIIISVAKELRKLSQEPLDGIKVIVNEEDITDVTAEIMGPDGVMVPNPEYTQSKKEGGGRRRKGKSSKKGEA